MNSQNSENYGNRKARSFHGFKERIAYLLDRYDQGREQYGPALNLKQTFIDDYY